MLKLICEAREFALVRVMIKYPVTSEKSFYDYTKQLVIDCSIQLADYDQIKSNRVLKNENFFNAGKVIAEKNDKNAYFDDVCPKVGEKFEIVDSDNVVEEKEVGNNPYRIVLDFNVDFNVPKMLTPYKNNWHWWIAGKVNNECPTVKLKELIATRKLGFETSKFIDMIKNNSLKINISDYSTRLFSKEYFVASPQLKDDLDAQTYFLEITSKSDLFTDKPTCVFLAGDPGTGKSHFIDILAKKLGINYYPSISLSEVKDDNFQKAIQRHIDEVYEVNKTASPPLLHRLAFVDEIDTNAKGLAFRLFLEAMTGKYRNEDGGTLGYKTSNLIWVFAGSTGIKKNDFIQTFEKDEKKVRDFFDRIHFHIELPSVKNSSAQAILHFLSMVRKYQISYNSKNKIEKNDIQISESVLALFGLTHWKSARQIDTIIKAASVYISLNKFETITLRYFVNILHVEEFCKVFLRVTNGISNAIPPAVTPFEFNKKLVEFENLEKIKALDEKNKMITVDFTTP
jgi:hypothetical protein